MHFYRNEIKVKTMCRVQGWLFPVFTCVALAKAGLVVGPLRPSGRPSVCPSVRPQHFRVSSLCDLYVQKFSFLYIQTLPNDCTHIEDVHLLLCARFIFFFFIFEGC